MPLQIFNAMLYGVIAVLMISGSYTFAQLLLARIYGESLEIK
jgi:hypothetical protein